MKKQSYGVALSEPGCYQLNKLPESGNFEYIYKNDSSFMKVDQFGPSFIQMNPTAGMKVIIREEREIYSPWKVYFSLGKNVFHNFDVYKAKKITITYRPEKAVYVLDFGSALVTTTVTPHSKDCEFYMNVVFENKSGKTLKIKTIESAALNPIDSFMAIWDKMEWYTRTESSTLKEYGASTVYHYSVNGKAEERRYIKFIGSKNPKSTFVSRENLVSLSKSYTAIPKDGHFEDAVVGYPQISAMTNEFELSDRHEITMLLKASDSKEELGENLLSHMEPSFILGQQEETKKNYLKLTTYRSINTPDKNFDAFVNGFLPLEMGWVGDLDRGWATGMRGSRDCANDFMGMIPFAPERSKEVIETLFVSQRKDDGWFPRQVPTGGSNKFDMRNFVDSNAFVIELIYEYLCYTNDFSLLDKKYVYLNGEEEGTGLEHLIKAASYYLQDSLIGDHGLIKLYGGDWLDCLNRVGLKGRAETLHVTCQAVLAFREVGEVLRRYRDKYIDVIKKFEKKTTELKKAAKALFNEEGFYNALYADDGNLYFSSKDIDGNRRVYVPSNAYTIIAGIDPKKDKKVIAAVKKYNRSENGFKIFSTPFGNPPFEAMGKMSTGDFAQYLFENGSVYNHAAYFFIRGTATAKDEKTLYEALNMALPYNQKFHPESVTCLPMYAATNSYNLIPGFTGRAGLCFLTGSIAMAIRSVYNWMFGLDFHVDTLELKPCLPKEYRDSSVCITYEGHKIKVIYHGYGHEVYDVKIGDKSVGASIDKAILNKNLEIEAFLK
ncbi:MAG: hypothetical protein MJ239_01855 [Bacilli bacterium]|nr:hypothetical protein [Bacilli bacterium]